MFLIADKQYTLIMVDPDVPYPELANNSHPLLHWLAFNNMVDGDGVLILGNNTQVYDCEGGEGGTCGTVVAHWTAGQQAERSILRQGHNS